LTFSSSSLKGTFCHKDGRKMIFGGLIRTSAVGIVMFAGATSAQPPPDLADAAAGIYDGNVISDARGSSRSGVRLIVTKIAPNTVSITASHPRLPPFSAKLNRYMNTIQKVGGPEVFLLDLSKRPPGLDVIADNASWSGARVN
jgi:hypothetical protein